MERFTLFFGGNFPIHFQKIDVFLGEVRVQTVWSTSNTTHTNCLFPLGFPFWKNTSEFQKSFFGNLMEIGKIFSIFLWTYNRFDLRGAHETTRSEGDMQRWPMTTKIGVRVKLVISDRLVPSKSCHFLVPRRWGLVQILRKHEFG